MPVKAELLKAFPQGIMNFFVGVEDIAAHLSITP